MINHAAISVTDIYAFRDSPLRETFIVQNDIQSRLSVLDSVILSTECPFFLNKIVHHVNYLAYKS